MRCYKCGDKSNLTFIEDDSLVLCQICLKQWNHIKKRLQLEVFDINDMKLVEGLGE